MPTQFKLAIINFELKISWLVPKLSRYHVMDSKWLFYLLVQVQYSPPWVIQFVDKKRMTVLSATGVPSPLPPP